MYKEQEMKGEECFFLAKTLYGEKPSVAGTLVSMRRHDLVGPKTLYPDLFQ